MNETRVTIVGNALHNPEYRRTANTGAMVATFKIASTARRLDKESGRWTDGDSLRVRVTCWRNLADNVRNSVKSGDPLIVTGRLYSRDWQDDNKINRTTYEMEANVVGHDLSRGRAVFERVKAVTSTSMIEDAESEQRIGGEPSEPVPDNEAPTQFNDMSFDTALEEGLGYAPRVLEDAGDQGPGSLEPVAVAEPAAYGGGEPAPDEPADPDPDGSEPDEPGQLEPVGDRPSARRRLRRRT